MKATALLCLLALVGYAQALKTVSASTTVNWSGGIPSCTNCGAKGEYACSTGLGQWTNGTKQFKDPLGGMFTNELQRQSAVLTSVTATVNGAWSCQSQGITLVRVSLNGHTIDVASVSAQELCRCNVCNPPIVVGNDIFLGGWPTYEYNSLNNVSLTVLNGNAICVNSVTLNFTYSVPDFTTAAVTLTYSSWQSNSNCYICNTGGLYTCVNSGYWNSGSATFTDPLPSGAILLSAAARIYGSFYNSNGPITMTPAIAGLPLGTLQYNATNTNTNQCNQCDGGIDFISSDFYQTGWPGYVYRGTNTFTMPLSNNAYYSCVSFVQLVLEYYQSSEEAGVPVFQRRK